MIEIINNWKQPMCKLKKQDLQLFTFNTKLIKDDQNYTVCVCVTLCVFLCRQTTFMTEPLSIWHFLHLCTLHMEPKIAEVTLNPFINGIISWARLDHSTADGTVFPIFLSRKRWLFLLPFCLLHFSFFLLFLCHLLLALSFLFFLCFLLSFFLH